MEVSRRRDATTGQLVPYFDTPVDAATMRSLIYSYGGLRSAQKYLSRHGLDFQILTLSYWACGKHLHSKAAHDSFKVLQEGTQASLVAYQGLPLTTEDLQALVQHHGGPKRTREVLIGAGIPVGVKLIPTILRGITTTQSPRAVRCGVWLRHLRDLEVNTLPERLRPHSGSTVRTELVPLVDALGGPAQACRLLQSVGIRIHPETMHRWYRRSPSSHFTVPRKKWLRVLAGLRCFINTKGRHTSKVYRPRLKDAFVLHVE